MSQAAAYIDLIARDDSVKQAAARTEKIARETKAKLESMKITMKVDFGAAQAKQQADVIVREAQRVTQAVQQANAAASGFRTPGAFAGQMPSSLSRAGQWRGSNPASADAPWLIRPSVPAGLTRQQRADYLRDIRNPSNVTGGLPFDPVKEARQRFAATGAGAMPVKYDVGSAERFLTTTIRIGAAIRVVAGAVNAVSAKMQLNKGEKQIAAGNYRTGMQNLEEGSQAAADVISGLPIAGAIFGPMAQRRARDIAKRNQEIRQADDDMVDRAERRRVQKLQAQKEIASLRMAVMPQGFARREAEAQYQLDQGMRDIDERVRNKELGHDDAVKLRNLQKQMFAANRMEITRDESDLTFGFAQKMGQAENIGLRLAGRGREADRNDFMLGLAADQRAADRAIGGGRNADQAALNEARLKEFDEQQKRESAAETARVEGTIRANSLRAAKQDYEADQAAFESAWDAKLATITDATDKENAIRERGSERELRRAMELRNAEEMSFEASQIRLATQGRSGEAQIQAIERRLEKALAEGGDEEDAAARDLASAELGALDKELRFRSETTKAAVFSHGSLRDLGAGTSDVAREQLHVLRERIAKTLEQIRDKQPNSAVAVAG